MARQGWRKPFIGNHPRAQRYSRRARFDGTGVSASLALKMKVSKLSIETSLRRSCDKPVDATAGFGLNARPLARCSEEASGEPTAGDGQGSRNLDDTCCRLA